MCPAHRGRRRFLAAGCAQARVFRLAGLASTALLLAPTLAPARALGHERPALRAAALKAPARLRLDHPAAVSVTVVNRGAKTVRRVAVRLSVGPIPDPGFKITWATAKSGPLRPGAARSFRFHVTISSRFDKDHTDKVSGQTVSFYGPGAYVLEACTGPTLATDEACRESHTITAS